MTAALPSGGARSVAWGRGRGGNADNKSQWHAPQNDCGDILGYPGFTPPPF